MSAEQIGTTVGMMPSTGSGLRARVSVLIDGVEQPLYKLAVNEFFVVSQPGSAFQIQLEDLSSDIVEIVVRNGDMEPTLEGGLWASAAIGTVGTTPDTITIEFEGDVLDKRPLVFAEGTGYIHVVIYNQYRYSSLDPFPGPFDDRFERGFRLGDLVIHYGPELPS